MRFLFFPPAVDEAWCKKGLIMGVHRVSVLLKGEQTQGILKLDLQVVL